MDQEETPQCKKAFRNGWRSALERVAVEILMEMSNVDPGGEWDNLKRAYSVVRRIMGEGTERTP